jgi:hypothetical protein
MSIDEELYEYETDEPPAENDHTLAWEWRVFAVALVWALPGVLFGGLLCLLLPSEYRVAGLAAGGLMGFAAGGLLEADYWG